MKDLQYYVDLARQPESIPEELAPDWAEWVAKPVLHYNLAPRQARAILEVVGQLSNMGESVSDVIDLILAIQKLQIVGISGMNAGRNLRTVMDDLVKGD